MAQIGFLIPDDYQNELIRRKASGGQSIRFQVLEALRKEWGWSERSMPLDGRLKIDVANVPEPGFNGHSAKNVPIARDGLPDFDAMLGPHDAMPPVVGAATNEEEF